MQVFGDPECAGAIFIFKNDGTETRAIGEAKQIAAAHHSKHGYTPAEKQRIVAAIGYDPTDQDGRFVYIVQVSDKDEFLTELESWRERTTSASSALLIYAHMGADDIGPDSNAPGATWTEVADALQDGVSSLWLVGCESRHCIAAWAKSPSTHPVKNWLVCTSTSVYWLPLIPHFMKELSLHPVYQPEQIDAALRADFGHEVMVLQREDRWVDAARLAPNHQTTFAARVAIRAHFLAENRTGHRWWDNNCNWQEARILELAADSGVTW